MQASFFTLIFVIFLIVQFAIKTWLNVRQSRYVHAHADTVPATFREQISLQAHRKSAAYTLQNLRLSQFELLYENVILLVFTLMGGIDLITRGLNRLMLPGLLQGLCLILILFTLSYLLQIPFGWYKTFKLEEKFGFNRSTPALFIKDLLLQYLLSLLLGGLLVLGVLYLMQSTQLWWLWAWLFSLLFFSLMMYISPTLLMPLFNKFSPIQDGEVKSRIQALAQRCQFALNGIFVMDSSKRSAHGNAFFTGFGKNRRIVFFDTLLETLQPAEIESVMAHELGHFKHKHVLKRMLLMVLAAFLFFAVLGFVAKQTWFYAGLGVSPEQIAFYPYAHALILFALVVPIFTFWFTPLSSWMSRKDEFQADAFAAQHSDAQQLVAALLKLYEKNSGTLTSDPIYTAYYYSHPPAPERIAHLQAQMSA
ncbi:M48 family metallopeptidase [Brackiella oedipodis]|uniref:M48 family metallopeptidase n=1 Tax=Brackiella oedipodis TaxID=124225 RepID=UPI00048C354B|nr:M48 family metallopeptidase [Brackiella oedipodis]